MAQKDASKLDRVVAEARAAADKRGIVATHLPFADLKAMLDGGRKDKA